MTNGVTYGGGDGGIEAWEQGTPFVAAYGGEGRRPHLYLNPQMTLI